MLLFVCNEIETIGVFAYGRQEGGSRSLHRRWVLRTTGTSAADTLGVWGTGVESEVGAAGEVLPTVTNGEDGC